MWVHRNPSSFDSSSSPYRQSLIPPPPPPAHAASRSAHCAEPHEERAEHKQECFFFRLSALVLPRRPNLTTTIRWPPLFLAPFLGLALSRLGFLLPDPTNPSSFSLGGAPDGTGTVAQPGQNPKRKGGVWCVRAGQGKPAARVRRGRVLHRPQAPIPTPHPPPPPGTSILPCSRSNCSLHRSPAWGFHHAAGQHPLPTHAPPALTAIHCAEA
ncbi:hypothetical protein BT67DRAFT_63655 [Trichocladium antarcticum]|uniref:Uncharacterized protein n=1 Tax=Trichocladium antarcticum TaxID=1450529 RepID=A0AAN6UH13_9PEZI|nr:hypothetical protein BT67DRAFT_63655 [Trichocladium antarcticum]